MFDLVGIAGNGIGAGKSTVAEYFIRMGFEKKPFAKLLKDAVVALDPIVEVYCDCGFSEMGPVYLSQVLQGTTLDEAKRAYPELRRLLQRMGTEVGRDVFGKNFWVDRTLASCLPGGAYVVDDVRYPNEAAAIKSHGGILIFVERHEGLDLTAAGHSSEAFIEELKAAADIRLTNSDGVEELYRALAAELERFSPQGA